MPADSIGEISNVQNPVIKDASEKALADAGKSGALNAQAYVEKNSQQLRQAGVLPELAIDGASEIAYVQKNFDKFDQSRDGHVTADEIDQYIKDNGANLKPDELEALRKVKEKISKLEDLSNDELGFENDGVTKKDLDEAQKRFKALDFAEKNFDKLDVDGDGYIGSGDIDGYIRAQGAKLDPKEAEQLDYLKKNISDLEECSNDEFGDENDGITRHDIIAAKQEDGTDQMKAGQPACSNEAVVATEDLRAALNYAEKNFAKLDGDKDGHITEGEIDQYMTANKDSVSPEDLANLRALKAKVSEVEELSNDEFGDENDGITKKDIAMSKERIDALAYGKENFDKLDGNGDGYVTAEDIDAYIKARGDVSPEEKKKLEYLKKEADDLQDYHNDEWGFENDGITKGDLADALTELGSGSAKGDLQKPCPTGENTTQPGDKPANSGDKPANSGDKPAQPSEKPKETIYEVKKGDTLWKISKEQLREANGGKEPTNSEIAKKVGEVAKDNGIANPDRIYPGQKIKFPGKPEAQSQIPDNGKPEGKPENKQEGKPETQPESQAATPEDKGADSGLDYVRKRFAFIDQDGDNHVTKTEIDKYIKDNEKSLTSGEVTALKRIASKEDDLEEMYNDELGDENDGITRQDLNVAEQRMKAIEFGQRNFDKLDGNGDGFVNADEIDSYVRANSDRLNAQERANLDYLKKEVGDLEDYSNDEFGFENDGFTKADLKDALAEIGSNTVGTEGQMEKLPTLPKVQPAYDSQTEKVKTEDFTKESLRLFDKLDKDGDGYLSESELATAVQSDEYKGRDAQVVAALYKAQDDIEELSNDELGDENDGITKADLAKLEEVRQNNQKELEQTARARAFLDKDDNFKKIDSDGDTFLTKSEISKALERQDLTPEERVSLEFLRDHVSDIEEAHNDETGDENDGITRKDLDYYGDDTMASISNTLWRTNEAQRSGTRLLYGDLLNPLESIKPDAIKQGMIGDCYFESAVASLAATDPESIQKMIKDNGDGTYTVTFPGATDEPITVKAPTEAEMGLYNQGGKDGSWACVLEKAYGAYCQNHFFSRSPFNMGGGNTQAEGSDGGEFFHGRAMSLLTGRGRDNDNLTFSSEAEIAKKLDAALNHSPKRPVLAGINNSFFSDETGDGFPDAHVYSVIGFDPSGPDGGTVTIRNPWGDGDNTTRGTIKISVKKFRANFSEAVYSE